MAIAGINKLRKDLSNLNHDNECKYPFTAIIPEKKWLYANVNKYEIER